MCLPFCLSFCIDSLSLHLPLDLVLSHFFSLLQIERTDPFYFTLGMLSLFLCPLQLLSDECFLLVMLLVESSDCFLVLFFQVGYFLLLGFPEFFYFYSILSLTFSDCEFMLMVALGHRGFMFHLQFADLFCLLLFPVLLYLPHRIRLPLCSLHNLSDPPLHLSFIFL